MGLFVLDIPPSEHKWPNIIFELATSRKSDTPQITYDDQYLTIRNRFPRHIAFYTDSSRDTERVSVAAVLINHSYGHRILDHSSTFTTETHTILLALEGIEHSHKKRFLIFTNSMSCLQALDHLETDHPIITQILTKLKLTASDFDIHLCWHVLFVETDMAMILVIFILKLDDLYFLTCRCLSPPCRVLLTSSVYCKYANSPSGSCNTICAGANRRLLCSLPDLRAKFFPLRTRMVRTNTLGL